MLNKDNIEEILKTLDPNDEATIEAILEQLTLLGFPKDLLDKIEELLKDSNHKDHNASKVLTFWLFQLADKRKQEKKKKKKKQKSNSPSFIYTAHSAYFNSQQLALCQYNIMEFNPNQILLKACLELAQNHINGKSSDYQYTLQEFQPYAETSKLNGVLDLVGNNISKDGMSLASTALGTAVEGVANQIAGLILSQLPEAIINSIFNIVDKALSAQQPTKSPYQLFGM